MPLTRAYILYMKEASRRADTVEPVGKVCLAYFVRFAQLHFIVPG